VNPKPRFSVVTLSFNQAAFLERALDSVLAQSGVDLEYIVIDPGSTDGSREILDRYRHRIAHLVFEPDTGPGDGLNKGLRHATGEFFAYLNADDELAPGALAEAVTALRRWPSVDVVYGLGAIIDAQGRRMRTVAPPKFFSAQLYALGGAYIVQQASFMRTEALRQAGGFNPDNRTCWDGEAFVEMSLAGSRFRRIWKELGLFRIHDASITGSGRLNTRYLEDQRRIFERVTERLGGASLAPAEPLIRAAALLIDPARLGARLLQRRPPA
jgi:glycosyltransferase involved in cell wall biosynthesis